jgi:hypothetical protein
MAQKSTAEANYDQKVKLPSSKMMKQDSQLKSSLALNASSSVKVNRKKNEVREVDTEILHSGNIFEVLNILHLISYCF